MRDRFSIPLLPLLLFFLLTAILIYLPVCAGSGVGLDENGNPIGSDGGGGNPLPVDFEPTFTNIQNNVFSAICVNCHIGVSAPNGLQLDPANSYDMLVGIASVGRPDVLRVAP